MSPPLRDAFAVFGVLCAFSFGGLLLVLIAVEIGRRWH